MAHIEYRERVVLNCAKPCFRFGAVLFDWCALFLTVIVFVHSGGTLHQQFGAHPSVRHTTPHHMAAKKKGDATTTSTDTTTTTTPPKDKAAPGQEPTTDNEDITVEDIAEGQHEVDLLDLVISAEDIAAM